MMSDKDNPVKPLRKINFFGKGESKQPFPIKGMKWKGLYYYIFVDDLQQLLKINKRYKSIRKPELVEPLRDVRLVGGGNVIGYKPFLYKGEQCVCILANHLNQLMKINREYRKLLRKRKRKKPKPKRKRIKVKPVRKIKKPELMYKLTEKGTGEIGKLEVKEKIPKKIRPKPVKRVEERPKKKVVKKVKKPKPRKITTPPRKIVKPKKRVKRKIKKVKPKKVKKRVVRKKKVVKRKVIKPKKRVVKRRAKPKVFKKLTKRLKRIFKI